MRFYLAMLIVLVIGTQLVGQMALPPVQSRLTDYPERSAIPPLSEMKFIHIHSDERYELMRAYAKHHYGLDHANLINPKIILIHYTALATLGQSVQAFKNIQIPGHRDRLAAYGRVNVGTHFLVEANGQVHSVLPTTLMARHVIGFNHTAIAIENVALDHSRLTDEQIRANAALVAMLIKKHPSLEYLVGHMEYMNQTYPHFKHRLALDESYEPTIKIDPGFSFMKRLRYHLKRDYDIEMKR